MPRETPLHDALERPTGNLRYPGRDPAAAQRLAKAWVPVFETEIPHAKGALRIKAGDL